MLGLRLSARRRLAFSKSTPHLTARRRRLRQIRPKQRRYVIVNRIAGRQLRHSAARGSTRRAPIKHGRHPRPATFDQRRRRTPTHFDAASRGHDRRWRLVRVRRVRAHRLLLRPFGRVLGVGRARVVVVQRLVVLVVEHHLKGYQTSFARLMIGKHLPIGRDRRTWISLPPDQPSPGWRPGDCWRVHSYRSWR